MLILTLCEFTTFFSDKTFKIHIFDICHIFTVVDSTKSLGGRMFFLWGRGTMIWVAIFKLVKSLAMVA